jgi:hypothetical protein
MVWSKLAFEVVCDKCHILFFICSLHLQPNIHKISWSLLDYNPIAMVHTLME